MKKKNITLVFVAIVFSIIVGMIIGKSLLKYKEGEPDVVGSFSMNRDENLTVVANRKNISDKEVNVCPIWVIILKKKEYRLDYPIKN